MPFFISQERGGEKGEGGYLFSSFYLSSTLPTAVLALTRVCKFKFFL